MESDPRAVPLLRLCAALLVLAAAGALLRRPPPPADLLDPRSGPPTLAPDLARDGAVRLSWLPGVGPAKARALVAARARMEGPLTAARLAELPGVGERTAADIAAWLARWGAAEGPSAEPVDARARE